MPPALTPQRTPEQEARLQALRTQEIGQIAESALVRLADEEDDQAHAFQREEMAALRDELAPPGSLTMERLLAEAIVKARFEAMMWSARSNRLLLERKSLEEPADRPGLQEQRQARRAKELAARQAREQARCEEQARLAEKRYLQALRELVNLRRLSAPLLQVNLAQPAPAPDNSTAPVLGSPNTSAWVAPSLLAPEPAELSPDEHTPDPATIDRL